MDGWELWSGPVSEGVFDGMAEWQEFEVAGDAEDGVRGGHEGVEVLANVVDGDEFEVFEFAFSGVTPGCWVGVLAKDFAEFLAGFVFDGDEALGDEVAGGFEFVGGEVWFADHAGDEWQSIEESVSGGGGGEGDVGAAGLDTALESEVIEGCAEVTGGETVSAAVEHFAEDGGGAAAFGEFAGGAGGEEE